MKPRPAFPPVEQRDPYPQEWVWVYSKTKGLLKFVFTAIARRMEWTGRTFATPRGLPASKLSKDTGVHEDTVQEKIQELGSTYGDELEVLKPRRRGEAYRYQLRLQARLPLESSAGGEPDVTRTMTGCHPVNDRLSPGGGPGGSDQDPVREIEEEAPAALITADGLGPWIAGQYPTHHAGQKHLITAGRLRKLTYLLTLYPADRLRELCEAMWTVTPGEDRWLALHTPDRGIDLLYARHQRLDEIVRARQARGTTALRECDADDLQAENDKAAAAAMNEYADDDVEVRNERSSSTGD